jgi:hypothetical protein
MVTSFLIALQSLYSLTTAGSPPLALSNGGISSKVIFGIVWIVVILAPWLLALLISRKRSRIAKWLLIILVAFGDLTVIGAMFHLDFDVMIAAIEMLPPTFGIYFLSRHASTDWLRND